jgi:hypothetical protein
MDADELVASHLPLLFYISCIRAQEPHQWVDDLMQIMINRYWDDLNEHLLR